MSELINTNDNRATIRWKLLTGASALALAAYISSAPRANAEDADRPTLWIELGGQMDMMQGLSGTFTAPFMSVTPTPPPYKGNAFIDSQHMPRFALDLGGKVAFQPEDSSWIFSAGIRYGRSHGKRHVHHQTPNAEAYFTAYLGYPFYYSYKAHHYFPTQPLADTNAQVSERHMIIDFQAGKDVGLGFLGSEGTSNISAGVRIAQFKAKSSLTIQARPEVDADVIYATLYYGLIRIPELWTDFRQYGMQAHATRSFDGIGPSLSWNGSAALVGNAQNGALELDFGLNAAILFGKQKAKTSHSTQTHHFYYTNSGGFGFHGHYPLVGSNSGHSARSRSVAVPNIGGYVGLSVKYSSAKISVGYRYDTFLKAMDMGIDAAKKSNVTFNGPYASISIGLGD